jgi:hypothetical protein
MTPRETLQSIVEPSELAVKLAGIVELGSAGLFGRKAFKEAKRASAYSADSRAIAEKYRNKSEGVFDWVKERRPDMKSGDDALKWAVGRSGIHDHFAAQATQEAAEAAALRKLGKRTAIKHGAITAAGIGATTAGVAVARSRNQNMSAADELNSIIELAAWTRKEGKSRSGGLNEKGRKSYERENPGSDLKAPSKEAGNPRRASFCARMSGMKKKLTSSKTANDPDSRINKSLKAWNCSAREDLNTILFAKKGGDYKRHWSQKKSDPKKKSSKKDEDSDESPAMEKKEHCMSAREELEVIQFGRGDRISAIAGEKLTARILRNHPDALDIAKDARSLRGDMEDPFRKLKLMGRVKAVNARNDYITHVRSTDKNRALSARDQLNTILMGVDTRPRDPMGRFDQAEDGAPNPQHMKITYSGLAAGAAGGAAFQGGGMGLKALVEKLKKIRK